MDLLIFLPVYLGFALVPAGLTYWLFKVSSKATAPLLKGVARFFALAILAPSILDVKESGLILPIVFQLFSKDLLSVLSSQPTLGYLFFVAVPTLFFPLASYFDRLLPEAVTRFLHVGWQSHRSLDERIELAKRCATRYINDPVALPEAALQMKCSEAELVRMIDEGRLKAYSYHDVLVVSSKALDSLS